jgi:hypothetical protein
LAKEKVEELRAIVFVVGIMALMTIVLSCVVSGRVMVVSADTNSLTITARP